MLIGSHDNNLYTNQELVGKTTTEVRGTNVLQLKFIDYKGDQIQPTSLTMISIERPETTITITSQEKIVGIGIRDGGDFGGRATIVNDTMQVIASSPAGHTIESIFYFQLLELTTNERTYNKFKFTN